MSTINEKLKSYFKRYPKSDEVFECGGQLFHNSGAAQSYGKGKVTPYTRKQVAALQAGENNDTDKYKAIIAGDTDLSTLDYNEMKAIAKALNIKPEGDTKENYIAALTIAREQTKTE